MNKEYFNAQELAGLPSMPATVQGVRVKADTKGWSKQKKEKGKGFEYHINSLPEETRHQLIKQAAFNEQAELKEQEYLEKAEIKEAKTHFAYEPESLWAHYESKPTKQKDVAKAKLEAMHAVMALNKDGLTIIAACEMVAKDDSVKWSQYTLRDYYYGKSGKPGLIHYNKSDWLAALTPSYTGRQKSDNFSVEAWDFFKADFLRLEEPNLTACYKRLRRTAEEKGWQIPSKKTVERKVNALPIQEVTLARKGYEALKTLFPHMDRTVASMHALDQINGDGYHHNVFIRFPDGEERRPKTWYWQDVYSRKILGYRLGKSENTDTIRVSFGEVVEKYGVPNHVTIDNTRAAANKAMTGGIKNRYRFKVKPDDPKGLFVLLDVNVHWTSVDEHTKKGHGQAKPIERAFGVGGLGEYVDKHPAFSGAYSGTSPVNKPENYGKTVIEYDDFMRVLEQEICAWNADKGRRTEIAGGVKSFDDVFEESYKKATIRKFTALQQRLWLLQSEPVTVARDGSIYTQAGSGVGVGKNRYVSDTLLQYRGKKVVVRFDPDDLHKDIHVYSLDGRYICDSQLATAYGFRDTDAAREHSRNRNQFIKATAKSLQARNRMDALEAARMIPDVKEPESLQSQVVEGVFKKVVNGEDHQTYQETVMPQLSVAKKDKEVYESRFIEMTKKLKK